MEGVWSDKNVPSPGRLPQVPYAPRPTAEIDAMHVPMVVSPWPSPSLSRSCTFCIYFLQSILNRHNALMAAWRQVTDEERTRLWIAFGMQVVTSLLQFYRNQHWPIVGFVIAGTAFTLALQFGPASVSCGLLYSCRAVLIVQIIYIKVILTATYCCTTDSLTSTNMRFFPSLQHCWYRQSNRSG